MSFPINVNIPNAPNDPADDQPLMKQNYANIAGFLAVDHIAPGTINDGYHQQIHMLNEANPGIGTANLVLYANLFNGKSVPWYYDGTGIALPLFNANATTGGAINTSGFASLFAGVLVQWGFNTAVTSGSFAGGSATGTVTFPTVYPISSFIVLTVPAYSNTAGPPSGEGSVAVNQSAGALTPSSFQWTFNSNSSKYTGFYWLAIGN